MCEMNFCCNYVTYWGTLPSYRLFLGVERHWARFRIYIYTARNITFMYSFSGIVRPQSLFHSHVSVSFFYIPRIGPHISLEQNRLTDPGTRHLYWIKGVGPGPTLAWPGWRQPDIPVEVDTDRLETSRSEGGVLKKLSLAGIAKLSRLKYRWLRFAWHQPTIMDSELTIGWCTQPANPQLIPQSSMKHLGLSHLAELSGISLSKFSD